MTLKKANSASPRKRERGLTLIEMLMAGSVLAVAACGLSAVLVTSMTVSAVNKETAQARAAAQQLLEQIQNLPAGDVFATFNRTTSDDPLGSGTAPGGVFEIKRNPASIEVDGMTAEVLFPGENGTGLLREDIEDPALGLPRDLNGDGVIDNKNCAKDYLLLPLRVRITWNGVAGERTYDLCSVLLNK